MPPDADTGFTARCSTTFSEGCPAISWLVKKISPHRTLGDYLLTHWGRVTHICVSKLTIIGSNNGLSPGWHQAIIWTNAGMLLTGPLGTNFSEIFIEIHIFSFRKMHLKMSGKWRPFCLSLNIIPQDPGRLHSIRLLCVQQHTASPSLSWP